MSVNSTDPGTLFGGAWERIQDTFLLCAGSSYAAGTTGGAATMAHTHSQVAVTSGGPSNNTSGGPSNNSTSSTALSVSQIPSHDHSGIFYVNGDRNFPIVTYPGWDGPVSGARSIRTNDASSGGGYIVGTPSTGGGGGHTHNLNSHTHSLQSHTHSIGATTTGGASNTNNMPPYLAVYVWKRTA